MFIRVKPASSQLFSITEHAFTSIEGGDEGESGDLGDLADLTRVDRASVVEGDADPDPVLLHLEELPIRRVAGVELAVDAELAEPAVRRPPQPAGLQVQDRVVAVSAVEFEVGRG